MIQKNFSYLKNFVKDNYVTPVNINPAKLIYNDIKLVGVINFIHNHTKIALKKLLLKS